MAREFSELRSTMSDGGREQNAERAAAILTAMDLAELRGSFDLTQEELASRLSISQSNVSRLERRRDMLVSTLREVVEALGGELHLSAVFPDGTVELLQFEEGRVMGNHRDPTSPAVAKIREQVADVMRRRGVVRAGIFGSVARGEAGTASDIDFLVEFEKGRSLLDLSGLRLELCEALGRDVDVATHGSLHPKLRDAILEDLVTIL